MRELGRATDIPSKQEVLERLSDPLRRVIAEDLDRPMEASRITQVALAKRNYLYWQGKQYLTPKFDTSSRTIDFAPVANQGNSNDRYQFASVFNLIYGDGIKFISIVGQRRPNQKAVPDDPGNEEMVQLAKDANAALRQLHRQWEIRKRMKEVAFHLWNTGRVFGYTHYVTDKLKYGATTVPIIDVQHKITQPSGYKCQNCGAIAMGPMCPKCGSLLSPQFYQEEQGIDVPVVTGHQQFDNGAVELDLLSVFHVATPFGAKYIGDLPFLSYQTWRTKPELKAMFQNVEDEDLDSGEQTSAEQETADALEEIEQPAGQQDTTYVDRQVLDLRWIRPVVYYAFGKETRDLMFKLFPQGVKVTRVNGKVKDLTPEKLDDYWQVCKTGTGEYINDGPLCEPLIPVQDDTNDFFNMARETILRGIPKTIVDGSLIDEPSWRKNESLVAEVIRTKTGAGQDISKMIGQLPIAKFSEQMVPFWSTQRSLSQDIGGIRPELYGGGPTTTTWRESSQRKNQAMMQLQPPFDEMQMFISGISENGIRELARYGTGKTTVAPDTEGFLEDSYVLDVAMLQEKGWHVEAEESVPMSFGERAERVAQIAMENPQLAQQLAFAHPLNIEQTHAMFGLEGYYVPGMYERQKLIKTIKRLLMEKPLQVLDPMTGQLVEAPSVKPDPFADKDHAFFADFIRAWCNSPAGLRKAEENPDGYKNVELFGMAQEQMIQPVVQPQQQNKPQPGAQRKQVPGKANPQVQRGQAPAPAATAQR